MIIQELAYKVTIKADEFLNGKKKVENEVGKLDKELARADRERQKELKKRREEMEKFGNSAVSAFRNAGTAAAGFLGIGAGLYGIKQLFTSTANEIVRASQQAKFFGSDVNKMFGVRRGFQQAGLNGDAFIGASGNARMALANIKDPTIFGGLTGAAQNLLTIGARTGININQLGDPNKALSELTRYGKGHSQENLMQVMAALGFDPTDAAKIKSGELKSLVDSETKKSNITAEQVKKQEDLVATLGELDSEFARLRTDLTAAFAPEVVDAMKAFGAWMRDNQGDIVGFFRSAGDKVKAFTEAVGGAENALQILAGAYVGSKALGAAGATGVGAAAAGRAGGFLGLLTRLSPWAALAYSPNAGSASTMDELNRTGATWQNQFLARDVGQHAQAAKRGLNQPDRSNNPGNLRPAGATSGFQSFPNEQAGWDAMSRQIMMYYNGTSQAAGFKQLRTVKAIISKWAPSSENDTDSYIKEVAGYMRVSANDELNLVDPNVMAKLRTAMAKREGFSNWRNGLNMAGSDQFQNDYYLQQQKLASAGPVNNNSRVDNSQSNSTHIGQVVVNSNPQSVDALTESIKRQNMRASTNASFSSSVG